MSLHDIDKNSSNRITPILNAADSVTERKAHGTTAIQNSSDPTETDGLKFLERQIIAVQDGENKAAMGFYGSANKFGLKVAQNGIDVLTATDDQLIFNSENNVFKIVKVMDVSVTINSPSSVTASTTTAHNLGFTPAYVAFITPDASFPTPISSNNGPNPFPIIGTGGSLPFLIAQLQVTVNESSVFFSIVTGTGVSGTFTNTARVYLMQETAN